MGDEKGAPGLTAGRLYRGVRMEMRIETFNKAEWARRTTRRLAAEFERIQKILASPVCQEIEQDLSDTKRLTSRLNEYLFERVNHFIFEECE
jgi:hypothetical protein